MVIFKTSFSPLLPLFHYRILEASDRTLAQFPVLNSWATGPMILVPIGLKSGVSRIAALSSKRTSLPSVLIRLFFVLITSALCTSPGFTLAPPDFILLIVTVIMRPTEATFLAPSIPIHFTSLAPVLSAIKRRVWGNIMVLKIASVSGSKK
jgi:hypothetical protein